MRPINIGKVREKLEKLKNPSAFKENNNVWKPKKLEKGETEGKVSTVRIVRNPHDDDPFVSMWFHYDVGTGPNRTLLCLKKNYGKDCPVCDFASELWKSDDVRDKDRAKKLFANPRHHAIIVDREDKEATPKYWGFSTGVYNELTSKLEHADYKDFMSYYEGFDIEVRYSKTNEKKQYPSTVLTFRIKSTPLAKTDDEIRAILNKIKKPEEIWQPLSAEEIKKQLEAWLASPSETVKGGGNGSVAADPVDLLDDDVAVDAKAVKDAFDALDS